MADSLVVLDVFLRGLAAGAAAAVGTALARQGPDRHARISAGLFAATVIAYLINASPELRAAIGPARAPVWLVSVAGTGFVWLFLGVLFEDWRIGPRTLAPAAALFAIGVAGMIATPPARAWVWVAHNLAQIGLATHALVVIARSARDDLVAERRRLRAPMMTAVVVAVLVISVFQVAESFGYAPAWRNLAASAAIATLSLVGAGAFLALRGGLFGRAEPRVSAPASEDDAQDRIIAARLAEAMDAGDLWRREGLTIGALAAAVGAPEHRLRRVINGLLGYRNFAAYLNAHRIAAAKAALAAPANATRTIAAVAFELGFGSLGPFNRAFKEATGLTPTEFRARALAES